MMGPLSRRRSLPAGRSTAALLVVLLGSALSGTMRVPAVAVAAPEDPRAEAKREVERAEVQYKLGRFDEALEGYSRAYELVNAPGLLFNIGQCHKNLKSYERAIFFFQEYLREAKRPERRALANELIAEARAQLEKQRLEPAPAADSPPAPPSPPPVPAWREPPVADQGDTSAKAPGAVLQNTAPAPEAPLTQKWWFWTAIGAGAVAVVTGIVLLSGSGDTVPPSGSVGTLDRRQ